MRRLLALLGALAFILGLSFPAYATNANISVLTEYSTTNDPFPAPNFHYYTCVGICTVLGTLTETAFQPSFTATIIATNPYVWGDGSAWSADTKTTGWNAAPLMNGTVGYWPMDEGSGSYVYDLSANGNTGTLENSPTWESGANCQFGSCLATSSSASSYVNFGTTVSSYFAKSFSICLWLRTTYSSQSVIVGNRQTSTWVNVWLEPAGYLNLEMGYNYPSAYTDFNGVAIVNNGAFNLICAIRNISTSTASLYVNGALDASGTDNTASDSLSTSSNFQTGGGTGQFEPLTGTYDDLRVYDIALTASEISELYASTVPVLEYSSSIPTTYTYNYYYQVAQTLGAGSTYYNLGQQYTATVAGTYWTDYSTPALAPATNTDISGLILAPLILGAVFVFMRRRR